MQILLKSPAFERAPLVKLGVQIGTLEDNGELVVENSSINGQGNTVKANVVIMCF